MLGAWYPAAAFAVIPTTANHFVIDAVARSASSSRHCLPASPSCSAPLRHA
ncbi:hypothetical protein [Streptomyces sp. NPDC005784]|uniref:hypothetical protein n=1 Tax=Streptomyces sp. NPDC005784 TaxID=3364731 RepID=UPI0036CCD327